MPSGLYAITSRSFACAYGTRSASGLRATRLYCTWFDSTGEPSAVSAARQRASEKLLTPTSVMTPACCSRRMPSICCAIGTTGFGQWIW